MKVICTTLNTFIYVVKRKLGQKDVYSFNDTTKKLQWPTTWPLTVHVMISCARTKQTMFVWHHAHQTQPLFSSHHHQPCLSLPPALLFTTTDLCDHPQMPTTTNDCTATMTTWKTKLTTHKQRWLPTYEPQLVNDGQQPCTDIGNNEPRWVSSREQHGLGYPAQVAGTGINGYGYGWR